MDLTLSEDQRFLRDEARRLLASRAGSAQVRSVVESGAGIDADLWTLVAGELGWCAIGVPAETGGLGLGLTEQMLLLEAAGERLAPLPLWSTTCLAAPLLAGVGSDAARASLLPRIAAGEFPATLAAGPDLATGVTARAVPGGYVLDGAVPRVVDLAPDTLVLVPARLDGHLALFALLPGAGHGIRALSPLDPTRRMGTLALDGLLVPTDARIDAGGIDPLAAEAALAVALLGLAAEQVGAARGAMDLTLAYIGERVQFGRRIASFQAVKHRCAMLEVDYAEARSLLSGAAAAGPAQRLMEATGARALASDLLMRAAEEAIQLHGGVGFTWEYDPHLYLRRAQASRALLGAPEAQYARIAAHLLDGVLP